MFSHPSRFACCLLILWLVGCGDSPAPVATPHAEKAALHPRWARPLTLAGVPNLHQVSTNLYRSAQPTRDGMRALEKHGIKTIVNLRSFHSDRDELEGTTLGYEHITMKAWHPEEKEIVRFLQIVTDPARVPVLVHCQHGSDRTGTVCALYRIVVEGWTREEALEEMTSDPYGFHKVWQNLPKFIHNLDLADIKARAGLAKTP